MEQAWMDWEAQMEAEWEANGGLVGMMGLDRDDVKHDKRGGDGTDGASLDGLGSPDGGGVGSQRWTDGHDGHDWRGHAEDDADDRDEGSLPVHIIRRGLRPDGHARHDRCWPEVVGKKFLDNQQKDCQKKKLND